MKFITGNEKQRRIMTKIFFVCGFKMKEVLLKLETFPNVYGRSDLGMVMMFQRSEFLNLHFLYLYKEMVLNSIK